MEEGDDDDEDDSWQDLQGNLLISLEIFIQAVKLAATMEKFHFSRSVLAEEKKRETLLGELGFFYFNSKNSTFLELKQTLNVVIVYFTFEAFHELVVKILEVDGDLLHVKMLFILSSMESRECTVAILPVDDGEEEAKNDMLQMMEAFFKNVQPAVDDGRTPFKGVSHNKLKEGGTSLGRGTSRLFIQSLRRVCGTKRPSTGMHERQFNVDDELHAQSSIFFRNGGYGPQQRFPSLPSKVKCVDKAPATVALSRTAGDGSHGSGFLTGSSGKIKRKDFWQLGSWNRIPKDQECLKVNGPAVLAWSSMADICTFLESLGDAAIYHFWQRAFGDRRKENFVLSSPFLKVNFNQRSFLFEKDVCWRKHLLFPKVENKSILEAIDGKQPTRSKDFIQMDSEHQHPMEDVDAGKSFQRIFKEVDNVVLVRPLLSDVVLLLENLHLSKAALTCLVLSYRKGCYGNRMLKGIFKLEALSEMRNGEREALFQHEDEGFSDVHGKGSGQRVDKEDEGIQLNVDLIFFLNKALNKGAFVLKDMDSVIHCSKEMVHDRIEVNTMMDGEACNVHGDGFTGLQGMVGKSGFSKERETQRRATLKDRWTLQGLRVPRKKRLDKDQQSFLFGQLKQRGTIHLGQKNLPRFLAFTSPKRRKKLKSFFKVYWETFIHSLTF